MQLMSWMLARLGSRFSLLLEPYQRRVMHSALGRFVDEPLDLAIGLIEPDGTQRVLPLTQQGQLLHNCEQFERLNSITYRGFSETLGLRLEFNIHSVFYPEDETLSTMPVFYLEVRCNPADRVRWLEQAASPPEQVKLFIRLERPHTRIAAGQDPASKAACIDLAYDAPLVIEAEAGQSHPVGQGQQQRVLPDKAAVRERIVSLTPGCEPDDTGQGLTLSLPVTEVGSGVKWRMVWAAHVADPVIQVGSGTQAQLGKFRYVQRWDNLDAVVNDAIEHRDDRLLHSRRFEKLIDEASLNWTQRHLINQSFQSFLGNTFWCNLSAGRDGSEQSHEWFSVWEGICRFHSTLDVEYNVAMFYLALWPRLLEIQFDQWAQDARLHEASAGAYLSHDLGKDFIIAGQTYPHDMPVEENCNFLLLLQAYAHWAGHLEPARVHTGLIEQLARYLLWTDRDGSGFPSEGVANTIDDASPAAQYARKQTYLAVKRAAALQAAADLLSNLGRHEQARELEEAVEKACPKIEAAAWLGDHYAVCVDRSTVGIVDVWTGKPLPLTEIPGWDSYSIYTANGLLLPAMVGQPRLLDTERLNRDITAATRECLGPYGCAHTSNEPDNVWISQNLWRDMAAHYLEAPIPSLISRYWDMQVMSNTHQQSFAFIDTYITNNLCFYPRGVTSFGLLLAMPRLVIDRLSPGGQRVIVQPDRKNVQRWPLLPLADWKTGRVPVCVVDAKGKVTIESELDPVIVHGQESADNSQIIG